MQKTLLLFLFIIIFSALFFFMDEVKILAGKILRLNSPLFIEKEFAGRQYRIYKPKNYAAADNKEKTYPLVTYLHGASERGDDNQKQSYGLSFLGNGFDQQAKSFRSQYPCFIYIPQCPTEKDWSDQANLSTIIATIENIISTHPIDRNRLYLIGYSMGGAGTYALASEYYNFNKQIFAGIIRIAGQGVFSDSAHEIIAKSSIWLHIGLKDTELRISKVREAFDKIKTLQRKDTEIYQKVTILNHPGTTTTSGSPNGSQDVRITEYDQDGHSISHIPFLDPSLMEWLFKQKFFNQIN